MSAGNYSLAATTEDTLQNLHLPPTNMSGSGNANISNSCPVMLSSYQFVTIPVLYCGLFLLGLVGNSLVFAILCRSLKTVANVYIFNLATADLLCLVTNPFWAVYYANGYTWHFGSAMCKISTSVLCLTTFASIFFITCMSVDRYQAVAHPFRTQRRRTLQRSFTTAMILWGLATLSSVPTFYFRDIYYIRNLELTSCVMAFPPEEYALWAAGAAFMKNILGFLIPMTIIGTCYTCIRVKLMKTQGFGKSKRRRDQVLKLVAALVAAFLVCWLPFHILTFLDALAWMEVISRCWVISAINAALPFGILLGSANSCINPFLYYFISRQFQGKLQRWFKVGLHQFSRKGPSFCSSRGSTGKDANVTPKEAEEQGGQEYTERLQTDQLRDPKLPPGNC